MSRPYRELRIAIMQAGFDNHAAFAEAIGMAPVTLSHRMNGRTPWAINEAWMVIEVLGRAPEDMVKLFPRNGRNEEA